MKRKHLNEKIGTNVKIKNNSFNVFQVRYYWYEGDEGRSFIGKYSERKEFEKDLIKAIKFAESLIGKKSEGCDYLGKGYSVECLPEYYHQIIWFLINKLGYTECYLDFQICNAEYIVDSTGSSNITLTRQETTIKNKPLK